MKKLLSVFVAFVMVMSSVLTIETMTDISVISKTASAASYTTGVYRVNHSNGVNVRKGAGTSYARVGAASKGVEFTVTQIKTAGGYTWGYTSSIRCTNGTRSGWLTLNNCKFIRPTAVTVVTEAPTISFSGMNFTTAFQQGTSKSISGTISSTSAIDSIRADVINSSGTTVLTKTVYPNSKSYKLAYSTLDYGLKFGSLPSDTYRLCYTVKSGSTTQYYNHSFVVVAAAPTITFSNMYFPSGIKYGKSQNIKGTISSTQSITNITATVTTSTGSTVLTKSDTPYTKSYTLKNSPLDYGLKFGSLAVGRYRLTYTVTSGSTTKTYTHSFAVEGDFRTESTGTSTSGSTSVSTNNSEFADVLYDIAIAQKGKGYSRYGGTKADEWCGYFARYVLLEAIKQTYGYDNSEAQRLIPYSSLINAHAIAVEYRDSNTYGKYYSFSDWKCTSCKTQHGPNYKTDTCQTCNPKVGSILLLDGNDSDLRPEHIGVIIKVNEDGSFVAAEGNTGSTDNTKSFVKIVTYTKSTATLYGQTVDSWIRDNGQMRVVGICEPNFIS